MNDILHESTCILLSIKISIYIVVSVLGLLSIKNFVFTLPFPFPGYCGLTFTPSVSYIIMNITFTAHCVGRTSFGREEPGCFHSFDWRFKFGSYEGAQVSFIAYIRPKKSSLPSGKIQQDLCDIIAVPLLHLGTFMGYPTCCSLRYPECRAECGAQFCDIHRLPLVTHPQSICDQHPTGK